jgi:spore maturation protein CgeB
VKIVYFTHSLRSCWNHGNAHFLRGVLRDLIARGHNVAAYEPEGAWSLDNLLRDDPDGLVAWESAYPELNSTTFAAEAHAEAACDGADLVIVHEWNDPALVAAIGALRTKGGRFRLLFHDTHHRAVSDPDAIRAFDLSGYDGVLAFGEALSEVYRRWGWGGRVWTWHEAADVRHFHPAEVQHAREGLVWIGNWGDEERSAELESFLFRPAKVAGMPLDVYGVRYPDAALATLSRHGARYHGWLPNARAPEVFARYLATVHVPRRFYTTVLPGVPTIRVFEALACGIPLASAPWSDAEGLFRPGQDYLVAADGGQMERHLTALRDDPALRASLVESGLETIRARHTCAHRVDELLGIVQQLSFPLDGGRWPRGAGSDGGGLATPTEAGARLVDQNRVELAAAAPPPSGPPGHLPPSRGKGSVSL